jgi:hypothetical protein
VTDDSLRNQAVTLTENRADFFCNVSTGVAMFFSSDYLQFVEALCHKGIEYDLPQVISLFPQVIMSVLPRLLVAPGLRILQDFAGVCRGKWAIRLICGRCIVTLNQ